MYGSVYTPPLATLKLPEKYVFLTKMPEISGLTKIILTMLKHNAFRSVIFTVSLNLMLTDQIKDNSVPNFFLSGK